MIKTQLSALIQLARADGELSEKELSLIMHLGAAAGLQEREIIDILDHPGENFNPDFLSEDERFECLYLVIQLMKIDKQVFKAEIAFCQKLAIRLGYREEVVAIMSSGIYSDPAITSDREHLRRQANKYRRSMA